MIISHNNFCSGFIKNRDGKSEKDIIVDELKEKYNLADFYTVKQTHSTKIVVNRGDCEADGIIVTGKSRGAAILTADCVPVILFDNKKDIAGIFHSGWRGTLNEIVPQGIKLMKNLGAKELSAIIYPAIQNCCFEIGEELVDKFQARNISVENRDGKFYADLNSKIIDVLKTSGIRSIKNFNICTACSPQLFSYRQNKTTKRHFSWIGNLS